MWAGYLMLSTNSFEATAKKKRIVSSNGSRRCEPLLKCHEEMLLSMQTKKSS